jgi:hypothetical protein
MALSVFDKYRIVLLASEGCLNRDHVDLLLLNPASAGVHEFPSAKYFIPGLGRKPFDLHTNSRQDKNIPQILASNSRQNKICY